MCQYCQCFTNAGGEQRITCGSCGTTFNGKERWEKGKGAMIGPSSTLLSGNEDMEPRWLICPGCKHWINIDNVKYEGGLSPEFRLRPIENVDRSFRGDFADILYFFPDVDYQLLNTFAKVKVRVLIGEIADSRKPYNRTYHFGFDLRDNGTMQVARTAELDVAFEINASDKEQASVLLVDWLKRNFPLSWNEMLDGTRRLNDGKLAETNFFVSINT